MRKKIVAICITGLLVLQADRLHAQGAKKIPLLTADSLASGNYKDVLTSFFQLAFDKLTGSQKELRFNSNPYAIMLRGNPELAVDTSYTRLKGWRNLNFGFGLKLDTNYHFNGFSSGVSYALINKRDYSVYHEFINAVLASNGEYAILQTQISIATHSFQNNTAFQDKFRDETHKMLSNSGLTYDKLSPDVRQIVDSIITSNHLKGIASALKNNSKLNVYNLAFKNYDSVKKYFQNRLLWTVSVNDTTYKDQFMFSNVLLSTRVLKGIVNPNRRSNLEIDFSASLNFLDDTARKGRDLKRNVLRVEPGLNWVLKEKANQQSLVEFKISGEYRHISGTLYKNESRNQFTFNGSFRIRIIQDIWIPLDFKYDPKKGNVFGFLSVKANFNGLKKS